MVLPIVANAIRALKLGWFPTFDVGFLQVRALDVGTRATPMVGMPSTLSGSTGVTTFHPGPLQSWFTAIPMRVFAFTPSALLIAQVLLNIVWIIIAAWVFARSPWSRFRSVGVVAGLLFLVSLGPEIAHDPWNPHAAVIPLAVALLATATVLVGESSVAWVAVLTGSFAAQCHLAFAAAGAIAVSTSLIVVAVRARTSTSRHLVIASTVFVSSWLGPIVDQVAGDGNLGHLLTGGGTGMTLGWHEAWSRFVKVLLPWRLLFDRRISITDLVASVTWWENLLAVGVLAVLVILVRGGTTRGSVTVDAKTRWVAALAIITVGAQIALTALMPVTMSTLFGLHLARAWWPIVAVVWVCVLSAFISRWRQRVGARGRSREHSAPRLPSRIVVAVVAIVSVVASVSYHGRDLRDGTWFEPTHLVADEIDDALNDPRVRNRLDLVTLGSPFESPLPVGVAADLMRRGYDVRVDAVVTAGLVADEHLVSSGDVDGSSSGFDSGESPRRVTIVLRPVDRATANDLEPDVVDGQLVYTDKFVVREWEEVEYEVSVYLT